MPFLSAANFPDWFHSTRQQILTPSDFIVNMLQRVRYPWAMLMKGRDAGDIGRRTGGTGFLETVKATALGNFGPYNPGSQASINIVGTTAQLSFAKRFYRSHHGWTQQQYNLQTAGGDKVLVKKFADLKEQDGWTEHMNGSDSLLFARPDYATMEGTPSGNDAGRCYSLLAFISEDNATYLPPSGSWGTNSLGGVNPATNTWWRNPVNNYTPGDIGNITTGIIAAFDRMQIDIEYFKPPDAGSKMQEASISDITIFTNKDGKATLQELQRAGNDRFVRNNNQDAAMGDITFDGAPIVHCPQLDTELLEQTVGVAGSGTSGAYTGAVYTPGRPRFFWVNKRHLKPVYEEGDMFVREAPMKAGVQQPDTWVVWTHSSVNIVCNDRRKSGVVAPF